MPSGIYVRTQKHLDACKAGCIKRSLNPEWRRKNKEANQKNAKDPEWLRQNKAILERNIPGSSWRINQINGIKKNTSSNLEWRRKNKEANQKNAKDPEFILKKSNGIKKKYKEDLNYRNKMADAARKRAQDYNWLLKNTESRVGGFWYGNVNHGDRKQYCELWNRELWNRIDTFQEYKSILSGKMKEDNKGENLTRHHVYYQPKACCEWDEDVNGYYVILNIGVKTKPIQYKYYIDGDPNKFVLLTRSEHSKVSKDKIRWIKLFENLIQIKYNGKCYYTKEEYEKYRCDHGEN